MQPEIMVDVISSFKNMFAHNMPVTGTINTTVEALMGPTLNISIIRHSVYFIIFIKVKIAFF